MSIVVLSHASTSKMLAPTGGEYNPISGIVFNPGNGNSNPNNPQDPQNPDFRDVNGNPILTVPIVDLVRSFVVNNLDSEQKSWWNDPENQTTVDQIKQYLNLYGYTGEGEGFAKSIIDAAMNNILISAQPFFKYPENSNYATLYPKLTEYLKNKLPTVKNNTTIVNAISAYTNMSIQQIQEHLQWGNGPTIKIEQLGSAYGKFKKNTDPNSLYIDIDLVNQMENTTPSTNVADAFIFLIGVTILHEYVHYGDYNYNGDAWQYPMEEGLLLEQDVYGQSVWIENAEIILKNN